MFFVIGGILAIIYIIIRKSLGLEDQEKNPMVGLSIFAIILGILYGFSDKR